MRIGLLTTSFPRRAHDVPGIFVHGFAEGLVGLGHHVEVLAPDAGTGTPPRFPGIDVRWVRYLWPRSLERTFYGAGVLDNLQSDPLAWLGPAPFSAALLAEAARRVHGWDALVSHWALPSALVAGLVRGTRPHLAVLHSGDVFLLERLPQRARIARFIAERATALVCSSRDLRRRFLALLPPLVRADHGPRVHVCPMGIPLPLPPSQARAQLRAERGLRGFTVLCLSRLVPLKGIERVIEAVAALPHAELVVAGDGPARAALEAVAQRAGGRVRFVGEVFGAEKADWLYAADAFVSASVVDASGHTEGMPTTLLEAMAHGLPVVASDVGGVSDLVEHGVTGLLVPPGDATALAQALARVSEGAAAPLVQEARARALGYTWDQLAPHFGALLG
jgi:glycosyltransferase involved in cell wall biosynthesis